jgi:hypothetical protein
MYGSHYRMSESQIGRLANPTGRRAMRKKQGHPTVASRDSQTWIRPEVGVDDILRAIEYDITAKDLQRIVKHPTLRHAPPQLTTSVVP